MRRGHAAGRPGATCKAVRTAAGDFIAGLMVFMTVFALAALDARPARPQPAAAVAAQTGQLTPGETEGDAPVARLFRERADNVDYLLVAISPPTADSTLATAPREVVFVIDTSASMVGRSIMQARKSLATAIGRLKSHDRFNVISFDARFERLFQEPVDATTEHKAIAVHYAERLQASGGTDMIAPLSAALKDDSPDDTGRVRQVVLITDGAIANQRQLFSEIAVKRGRSRLFLIGIGPAPDDHMLRRAAEIGRGNFVHIGAEARIAEDMERFLTRLERPVMTGITIAWPKGVRAEASPDPLPDLYVGQPLIVTARATALKGPVAISGTVAGRPWTTTLDVGAASPGAGVAKLWARRKIASLEARRLPGSDLSAVDRKIEEIAVSHQLTSGVTSPVAFDGRPLRGPQRMARTQPAATGQPDAVRRPVPANRPDAASPHADDSAIVVASRQAYVKTGPAASLQTPPLLSGRLMAVGVMALFFAAMSALTIGLWRHLGRLYTSPRSFRRTT